MKVVRQRQVDPGGKSKAGFSLGTLSARVLQCWLGCCGIKVADKQAGFRLIKIVGVLRAGPLLLTKFPVPH